MRLVIYAFFPPNLSKIMGSDTLVVDGTTWVSRIYFGILIVQVTEASVLFGTTLKGKPGTVNKVCHCWTWLNLIWLILAMLQTIHVLSLEMTSSSYYGSSVLVSAELRCRSLAAYVILKYKDKNWEYNLHPIHASSTTPAITAGEDVEDASSSPSPSSESVL
ncbi:unnamed protein product [Orchesella dallaii]|uniref:Uncharacterized protein n=1 Tax=Orchesella dallaii TaxID=48710 RepID=A0ABP1R8Q5_9HEXA